MKKLEFTGQLEVLQQEGGFCSPIVNVDNEDLTDEISNYVKHLLSDPKRVQGLAKGIYRVTVERVDQDD